MIQLEFPLEDKTPDEIKLEYLKKEILEVRTRSENVRKGLFARHNELAKMYLKQQDEINDLKDMLRNLTCEKQSWVYQQNEKLFEIKAV